jgi:hypothetical protein
MNRPKPRVLKLGDCTWDKPPKCFHCGAPFPETAKAQLAGRIIIIACPSCKCLTPFKVT